MPDFLTSAFGDALVAGNPLAVFLRILGAVVLGSAVAWVHRRTSGGPNIAMQATLVLLAGLIAMVTQVIGDNVARAFSLVGALSIVRFRTVVRDTRDTAFVIFSVAVGMAIGAQAPWAALMGVLVVGGTAFLLAGSTAGNPAGVDPFLLALRSSPDWNPEATAGPLIDQYVTDRKLHSVRSAKQGMSLDHCYIVCFKDSAQVHELVKQLNRLEGVQELKLLRQGSDEETSRL